VTVVPTGPAVGEKDVTAGETEKVAAEMVVPPAVVTAIAPDVASAGTVAEIEVAEVTL